MTTRIDTPPEKIPLSALGSGASAFPISNKKTIFQRIWEARTSYILLLPFIILFSTFILLPVGISGYLSLTDYRGSPTKGPEYVGFENFQDLLGLQIARQTQATDEDTGELLFECGEEEDVLASAVSGFTSTGIACVPQYTRSRDLLEKGYGDIGVVEVSEGNRFIIGATDKRFWKAMVNTITYVMWVVPLGVVLGLSLALILQKNTLINLIFRIIFFLPSVTSTIAIAVVWRWIFNSENYGLINGYIENNITFLADQNWTMPILVLMAVWGGMGYTMILFLAGLQSIPASLYEAAQIDGATPFKSLMYITIPLLRPTLLYVVVTGTITAFQVFDSVYVVFRSVERIGGVLDSGLTVVPYLYDTGFGDTFQMGDASAIAWVLFAIIFLLTMVNLRLGRVETSY
ncbi:MAG: sugar ABC transporter permease [bacterium]|nr:sugar ABC transporter permease [bacterium]